MTIKICPECGSEDYCSHCGTCGDCLDIIIGLKTPLVRTEWVVQVRNSEWVGPNYKWSDYITRASKEEIKEAKTKKYLDVGNYKDLAEYMFTVTNPTTLEFRTIHREIREFVEQI